MGSPTFNEHVGRRIRRRRRLLGFSQTDVARRCGVGFQQIQKYECGSTTVSAERLWLLSCALAVEIGYFFEGLRAVDPDEASQGAPRGASTTRTDDDDPAIPPAA